MEDFYLSGSVYVSGRCRMKQIVKNLEQCTAISYLIAQSHSGLCIWWCHPYRSITELQQLRWQLPHCNAVLEDHGGFLSNQGRMHAGLCHRDLLQRSQISSPLSQNSPLWFASHLSEKPDMRKSELYKDWLWKQHGIQTLR